MARQQWVPTEGMIVDVANALGHHESKYTIEVRSWDGALIRREVKHKLFPPYTVGSRLKVEISADNQIRFDARHPGEAAIISTMNMSDQIQEAAAAFDGPGSRGPVFDREGGTGGLPPFGAVSTFTGAGGTSDQLAAINGLTSLIGALGASLGASGTASTHVIGPDGQPVAVDGSELKQLIHDAVSGDPAARQAARDRIHQIKAQNLAQRADQVPPGTAAYDPAGAQAAAGTGQVFDQPPPGYGQAPAFDQPPAFGDGDTAGVAQRLATLQNLLSTGILTQSEYGARRQQIISEI